ncbi:MAG: class II aldolase/adducin family protein [Anaerolineae bacterium]|nr:class II aldolase/adducin family protein [Anaerolineae bacterium]MDW8070231.1 class II aldolase/adducin family protein [Anaerolineae bacterium]
MDVTCSEWERECALREEMVRIGRLMYERGYVVANDGNLSVRMDENRVLCTPSGLCKGMMTPEQMIIVDMEGRKVEHGTAANRTLMPTSEVFMHLEAYRRRPDIRAVVHAHPPTAVALSIAGVSLANCMLPEVIVNLGLVPTTQYATPASLENVSAIRELIVGHDGIVLQRHGVLTVGRDLLEAYMRLETIEQVAKITLILEQLGRGEPLPFTQVEKLLEQRRKMGLARPGEEAEFSRICSVPPVQDSSAKPHRTEARLSLNDPDVRAEMVRVITRAVLRELGYPD